VKKLFLSLIRRNIISITTEILVHISYWDSGKLEKIFLIKFLSSVVLRNILMSNTFDQKIFAIDSKTNS
jgi:hypothetical protein